MNSTTGRIAASIVGAVAVLGAAYGAASAADEPAQPDACAVAIRHADHMVELHGQVVSEMGALGVALDMGMDDKASQIRAELEADRQAYFDAGAMYQAAAAQCR